MISCAILQSVLNFFATGERVGPSMEEPPEPGPCPVFPSKDEFALMYYSATPVSLIPNKSLLLSFASQVANSCSNHVGTGMLDGEPILWSCFS